MFSGMVNSRMAFRLITPSTQVLMLNIILNVHKSIPFLLNFFRIKSAGIKLLYDLVLMSVLTLKKMLVLLCFFFRKIFFKIKQVHVAIIILGDQT